MPRLNEGQFQPRMFDPPERQDPNIYMHYSSAGLDPDVTDRPLHMGTQQASVDLGGLWARGTMYALRPRGEMANAPEMPVSDAFANAMYSRPGSGYAQAAYEQHTGMERPLDPDLHPGRAAELADKREDWEADALAWQEENIENIGGRGLYYENSEEDRGSTSVVVSGLGQAEVVGQQPYRSSDYSRVGIRPTRSKEVMAKEIIDDPVQQVQTRPADEPYQQAMFNRDKPDVTWQDHPPFGDSPGRGRYS